MSRTRVRVVSCNTDVAAPLPLDVQALDVGYQADSLYSCFGVRFVTGTGVIEKAHNLIMVHTVS